MRKENECVPIADKYLLTIKEAAMYTNIGINRIENKLNEHMCPFVFYSGNKRLVKRIAFEKYISENVSI